MISFNIYNVSNAYQFKCQQMWTSRPLCINVVKNAWKTKVAGCPMFILTEKLKLLSNNLKN